METATLQVVQQQLERLRSGCIEWLASTPLDERGNGSLSLSIVPGEAFGMGATKVQIQVLAFTIVKATISIADEDEETQEELTGTLDSIIQNLDPQAGLLAAFRSLLLRLEEELCLELGDADSAIIRQLGRQEAAPAPASVPPTPLQRAQSQQSQATSVALSLESEDESDMEMDRTLSNSGSSSAPTAVRHRSLEPEEEEDDTVSVEDVMSWDLTTKGLRELECWNLEISSCGRWDGREALFVATLRNQGADWEAADIVVIATKSSIRVELKMNQALPDIVPNAVAAVNAREGVQGPGALRSTLRDLYKALGVDLPQYFLSFLEGEKDLSIQHDSPISELDRQIEAVKALKEQLGVIGNQLAHLQQEQGAATSKYPDGFLAAEIKKLQRTQALVKAEKEACDKAVSEALISSCQTKGTSKVPVVVSLADLPSQSLRGRTPKEAGDLIVKALSSHGPWAHYAAFQFSTMIQREQELQKNFYCFYHSYNRSALLYEVQAAVARELYHLPLDFPPLPRLGCPKEKTSLETLRKLGGQDHNPAFRSLGLSASCSIFASKSEAPPLTYFQGGYSCDDLSFRKLLVDFLEKCCEKSLVEKLVKVILEIGSKHELITNSYGEKAGHTGSSTLSGYMLQIFVRKDLAEQFAYPSAPMGTPLGSSVQDYLDKTPHADGQARVLFHPATFLDPSKARLFHYCSRPLQSCASAGVAASRGSLVEQLRKAIKPCLRPESEIRRLLNLS